MSNKGTGDIGPEVTTHAIILNQSKDRVLLIKWKDSFGNVAWSFPGGHIERGESIKDALYREVREETGCRIRILDFLGNYENILHREGVTVAHLINILWIVSIINREYEFNNDDDVLDIKWVPIKDINKVKLTNNAVKIITDFIDRKFLEKWNDVTEGMMG